MTNKYHKVACEVFGKHITAFKDKNLPDQIKKSGYKCLFTGKKHKKLSRLISYPMGVDSVYWNGSPVVVSPDRYLQDKIIFKDISNEFLGGQENILTFPEVKLKNVGSFDFVAVKHKSLESQIEDFVLIELQSDSTTGTGKLVENLEDLMNGGYNNMKKSYGFGMNTYNTIKLSFIQMLNKGLVAESWGKHIVWVMQDFIFKNMLDRFEVKENQYTKDKNIHYFIYQMILDENTNSYNLNLESKHSYSVKELLEAFGSERNIPSKESFVKKLEDKVKLNLSING